MLAYGIAIEADEDGEALLASLERRARIADRDKELLIVDEETDADALEEGLRASGTVYERFRLLRLPQGAEAAPQAVDYGFVSEKGTFYLYAHLCAVFRFDGGFAEAEPAQAEEQMQEHLLARLPLPGGTRYIADRSLNELMQGIAKAYRCKLAFEYGE
ncbi:hypothetical protein ACFFNY_02845 [Paenibacillus hodogayensis]|uniref:Uncharacterized protein n=1 Tax=Paenibacillus hodogayensis TaxID=279208 RepID=A0ABV5VQE5_9BACL